LSHPELPDLATLLERYGSYAAALNAAGLAEPKLTYLYHGVNEQGLTEINFINDVTYTEARAQLEARGLEVTVLEPRRPEDEAAELRRQIKNTLAMLERLEHKRGHKRGWFRGWRSVATSPWAEWVPATASDSPVDARD
jgi:hypothetical protein